MNTPRAIIFDLYGTLLEFDQRAFLRDLLETFDKTRKQIVREVLQQLLVRKYSLEAEALVDWCRVVGIDSPDAAQLALCDQILQKHIGGIRPLCSARTILAFLKRRGWKMGLLSNAAQPFTPPLKAHGMDSFFDCISFSCETGLVKPNPACYLDICRKLGVLPEDCLFIGDSYKNDYLTPISLGMQALCIGRPSTPDGESPFKLSQVAWANLGQDSNPFKCLIAPDKRLHFCNSEYAITDIKTLPDSQHGRYNIISHVNAKNQKGAKSEMFCKRYLSPESAYVEDTAYRVMDMLGMSACHTSIVAADEPFLVVSCASGNLWTSADLNESSAEIIGAHFALAYMIGNADFHPRNAFVHHNNGVVTLSIIDLEHCFFERALDLRDCSDPFSPVAIDNLGESLDERTRHRVFSPAACHKARKRFFPVEDKADSRFKRFKEGFLKSFELAHQRCRQIETFLMERIYKSPAVIIGTHAYRRAMATLDVKDMLSRIQEDGAASLERNF